MTDYSKMTQKELHAAFKAIGKSYKGWTVSEMKQWLASMEKKRHENSSL